MDFVKDLAPIAVPAPKSPTPVEREDELPPELAAAERRGASKFSQALAAVEHHRSIVRATIAVALLSRVFGEYQLVALARDGRALERELPFMGLALLSYLVVLWLLAARTRDRFGFAMALGIGVLEATYAIGAVAMTRPLAVATAWPMGVVALAHVPMAGAAFRASTAFPPHDGKRPWILGFIAALGFLTIPWVAPAIAELL